MFSTIAYADEFSNDAEFDYSYDESYDENGGQSDETSSKYDDIETHYNEEYDSASGENYYDEGSFEPVEEDYTEIIDEETFKPNNNYDYNADGVTVYINGKKIEFDVQPIIINGRTMVPMRKIFEELGAIVGWNGKVQMAFGCTTDTLIQIGIGNDYLSRNGERVYLDSPAIVMSGRTLVPARAIAESLNCKVEWLGEYQIVEITKENIEYLPQRTELRIGWCEYAPINYRDDNGKLIGFDTELAEYVCQFWGWKPTFVEIPFEDSFPSIMEGKVDCYWNAVTATEERAEISTFTNSYLETDVDYEDVDGTWGVSHEIYSVPFQKYDYLTVHLTNIALEVAKADGTIDDLKYKYGIR